MKRINQDIPEIIRINLDSSLSKLANQVTIALWDVGIELDFINHLHDEVTEYIDYYYP